MYFLLNTHTHTHTQTNTHTHTHTHLMKSFCQVLMDLKDNCPILKKISLTATDNLVSQGEMEKMAVV